jgi:hypothetical protein
MCSSYVLYGLDRKEVKAQVKYLDGLKWKLLNIADLKGTSIINHMKESDKVMVGALLDKNKPVLFVSNNQEQVETYKPKGISLHVDDVLLLLGSEVIPPVVFKVFPDATFEKMVVPNKTAEGKIKDPKVWWNE